MLPTLRQLRYLKLLAEHGSFSRAAEAAHVTQPTLSAGIQELERVLGASVVDRGRAGVTLTRVGEEAVTRGSAILAQAEDLVEAARSAGRPLTGRFRLGVIPTIAPFLLPRALPVLRERYPELRLFLREDLTGKLIAGIRSGALDGALIALPYDISGLASAPVGDDRLLAAFPTGHPLSRGEAVDVDALRSEEVILLEDGHCLREHALGACGVEAPRGEDAFAATSLHTLVQMISSGLGVSLLPEMAVDAGLADGAGVSVRPIELDAARREIVVVWRAGSSRGPEAALLAQTLSKSLAPVTTPPRSRPASSRAPALLRND